MTSTRALILLALAGAPPALSPAQQPRAPGEPVIARAGSVFIPEKEFIERYEMLPGFGRQARSSTEAKKLELLYSMIAEKLLAQDALERHLDTTAVIRLAVEETRKLLARDALYRKEVIDKTPVTGPEIGRGVRRALLRLSVRYIYFGREEDALFVRRQMHRAEDFTALRIDSSLGALRDTASVAWGEADPAIEDAAYRLAKGEISPVVRAGTGYYIMTLEGVGRNFDAASLSSEALREKVATALKRRKEKQRLEVFTEEALRGKTGYAVPRALNTLIAAFERVYRGAGRDSIVYLTPARASAIDSLCAGSLGDTLAVAGDRVWNVGDVIARLTGEGFGVHRTSLGSIPVRLNTELMGLVQRELLGEEALRRGLDTSADVRAGVEIWRQSFLSALDREAIASSTTVSDAEVWSALHSSDTTVAVPRVRIRELRTSTFQQMQSALEEIAGGASMEAVVREWSNDPRARESGGVTPLFPVSDRPPVGEIASRMKPGERYGPISLPGGPLYFELLEKSSVSAGRDTSLPGRFARARQETLERKVRRAVTLRLASLAGERGVDIYTDRLKGIHVTQIPMMTFRILGFGGRMLAVPFVIPELDWLGVDRNRETTVP